MRVQSFILEEVWQLFVGHGLLELKLRGKLSSALGAKSKGMQ